jgi:flavin reductase (DIM6/NTAB) family NADH-FMN oxidoreductase RutF
LIKTDSLLGRFFFVGPAGLLAAQGAAVHFYGERMESHIAAVALEKAYRLINHGPTILVSAQHGGVTDVMAASWACALDFSPPKLTVVLDKATRTRELIEASGTFVIQVPTVAQLELTHQVGTRTLHDDADKLQKAGVEVFDIAGFPQPFVAGCSAWLACRLIPEPHNQQTYDLFIGEVIGAWADDRVFRDGHWHFESAPAELRSLHYIAGGNFYAIGERKTATDLEATPTGE